MTHSEISHQEIQVLTEIDRFIHEPARLLILAVLSLVDKADFTFVLNQTGLSRGNLSVQMNKLADAGLISIEKEFVDKFPRTMLSITPQGKESFSNYRENIITALNGLG